MIIGGVSENLLLTILQRVEELYREVTYGRTEGSHSSRYGEGKSIGVSVHEHGVFVHVHCNSKFTNQFIKNIIPINRSVNFKL